MAGKSRKKPQVRSGRGTNIVQNKPKDSRENSFEIQSVQESKRSFLVGIGYLIAAWAGVATLLYTLGDPDGPGGLGINDAFFLIVVLVTGLYGIWMLLRPSSAGIMVPEQHKGEVGRNGMDALFGLGLLAFLFAYYFALTANLDYVQRLQLGNQALNLSIDSGTEQRIAFLRFLPFLVAYVWSLIWYRPKKWWVFPVLMVTPFIHSLAFPTQFSMEGVSFLILFMMVPLFLALDDADNLKTWFVRGFFWGIFSTMIRNYWLGTYSLVTLQGVALVFTYRYGLFFLLTWPVYRWLGRLPREWAGLRWLLLAVGLTVFEFWAGHSWVGYPWTLAGQALYNWTPFIQFAAMAGIWGVSFIVYVLNSTIAWSIKRRHWLPVTIGIGIFLLNGLIGWMVIPEADPSAGLVATYSERETGRQSVPRLVDTRKPSDPRAIRLSLIQQNEDPRKSDYDGVLDSLFKLTDLSTVFNPDLVVWSETAFPPNIRHWSEVQPKTPWERTLVRQVGRFTTYQRQLGLPLLTGNDDYYETYDEQGNFVERTSYNAAILFDESGNRVDTYHKMVLVPLTEAFPYESFFPVIVYRVVPGLLDFFEGLLDVLKQLDVNLWGEGTEHLVFDFPGMPFSVPICFEDAFPYHVRDFVQAGARVIVNISNDYWALDEVQAQQHYAAGMFRAVENRVPMVRSTASGVTGHVDAYGRLLGRIPSYEAGFVVTDVVPAADDMKPTIYTRFGDWFPKVLMIILGLGIGMVIADWVKSRILKDPKNQKADDV